MTSCSKQNSMRRCRPLLGTFVEITAEGLSESDLHRAFQAAFTAIERFRERLSVHDPASELSFVNQHAAKRPLAISHDLFLMLRHAAGVASASNGGFDY